MTEQIFRGKLSLRGPVSNPFPVKILGIEHGKTLVCHKNVTGLLLVIFTQH